MTTQDCLTYLLEAIALTFAALMLIDFATGLPLQLSAPIATPNPLDMSAIFDAVDNDEECPPMADKLETVVVEDITTLPATPICQPLVAKTVIAAAPERFDSLNIKELRRLGSAAGIKGAARMNKLPLIAQLSA